jgi:large subunit ribosomal protein L5e
VIAQIVHTELAGDKVVASAYSSELSRYGLKVGLKNYAAAYCTGLLVARRMLTKLKLADAYKGNTEVTGKVVKTEDKDDYGRTREFYVAKVADGSRPFRVFLDVGIRATTTGSRVFGAMKGAADGGLDIPHNEKRFPGYNRDSKEYKPEELKSRIFGVHVADFQEKIKEDDSEEYERMFSAYVKAGIAPEKLAELYAAVHKAIRKDPAATPKKAFTPNKKFAKPGKSTLAQRKARVAEKKAARMAELQAAVGGEDDE